MSTAATLYKNLEEKRNELAAYFEKHKTPEGLKMTKDETQVVRERNDELTEIAEQWEAARDAEEIAAKNMEWLENASKPHRPEFPNAPSGPSRGVSGYDMPELKSLGEQFIESGSYKSFDPGATKQYSVMDIPGLYPNLKATFTTSGSALTAYDRQPGIVMVEQQKLTILDLLARGETTMNTIRYVQETSYTNAATTVSEGGTKPEATFATNEADAPVRKIAVTAKVTDELFADFPAIRDYINMRMPFMVNQQLETQLLSGNGTPPNMTGILNTSGIQTQATGADTNPDAIYKAAVKVRTVGFFEPDGVVIHPNNWTPIRLLKTTTGEYVWGHPAENGPERLWGLLVDVTTAITANTALVGAFRLGAQVFFREGIRMEATNSNEDDFKKNLIALRCELRAALAVYRTLAFTKVTGLS